MAPSDSLSPGRFAAGPERDLARLNRAAFLLYLRESLDRPAREYREACEDIAAAKVRRARARAQARAGFKRAIREGEP